MALARRELGTVVPKVEPDLNRKSVERVKFAKALSERCKWSVQDFAEKLDYEDAGICGKTECGIAHITDAHLQRVFPKKGGSGIRVVPNEFITEEECAKVCQLYFAIYNHPPPNKEYARYFLRSWLAEREGKARINWAKFAYDVCRKQYTAWEKDGRVEEACRMKWDDLQTIPSADNTGLGLIQQDRRQIGARCPTLCFTEEQKDRVHEMLRVAEAENGGIGPKISVLEYRMKDLAQQCKRIDGALAERQKSLREEQLSCANMEKRRESLVAHFEEIRKGDGLGENDVVRDAEIALEEEKELKIIDRDLEFGVHILNRERARTEELEREQLELQTELQKVEREIHLRGVGQTRSELWVATLTDQVHMMAVGSGMGTSPLPIRNPRVPDRERGQVIYVSNCPVCGFNFLCHNIVVADCSCTYHHFCMAAWLSDGKRRCARDGCHMEFCADWLDSFGANQVKLPTLRQPKLEGVHTRFNNQECGNIAAAASTNFQCKSEGTTPASLKHEEGGTPSSGQVKTPASSERVRTPASTSWKTPYSIGGTFTEQGRAGGIQPLACRDPAEVKEPGNPSQQTSVSAKTSDESTIFRDDEVCLSQRGPSLETAGERVSDPWEKRVVIPETLPRSEGMEDHLGFPEESEATILPDMAGTERGDEASMPTNTVVPETEMDTSDPEAAVGDTLPEPPNPAQPGDSLSGKVCTQQGKGAPLRSHRQAALRNKLCPSPDVEKRTPVEASRVEEPKTATVGRGKSTQAVARPEKGCNMKPLAHFGLQEKFRAPGVVTDAAKGRGRGGKPAKRKRDG